MDTMAFTVKSNDYQKKTSQAQATKNLKIETAKI